MKTQQQNKAIGWNTMMIKSKAANKIKRYFNEKDDFFKLTNEQKFQAIEKLVNEMYWELKFYKQKRQEKTKIEKLRKERGYKPKKKTSLEEYNKMKVKTYPDNWYMKKD